MKKFQELQTSLCEFFDSIKAIAQQLTPVDAWCRILTRSVSKLKKKDKLLPRFQQSIPVNEDIYQFAIPAETEKNEKSEKNGNFYSTG